MAFTSSDDINILQASDASVVGAGAGDDRYILSGQMSDNQVINLTDTDGNNTLHLADGLTIASSVIANNALQLTLSNGAVVNIFGANQFSYLIAGDSLSGDGGTLQDYQTFVTSTLGASSVPDSGVVNGQENVVINGEQPPVVTEPTVVDLQEGTSKPVTATEADEIYTFDVAAALALTDNTQNTLNDFDVNNDTLKIDSITATGATTLDGLNGVDGIAVQVNEIEKLTLINFGADQDGDVVALTLQGIINPESVTIDTTPVFQIF